MFVNDSGVGVAVKPVTGVVDERKTALLVNLVNGKSEAVFKTEVGVAEI